MDNPGEILRLCRLCLVKDQVNIPIFEEQGDIRQIFLKISSCLPVTVSRDDQLPKKICDGCSNKLDLLYEFWNTSANAEKTLLSWLGQAGVKDADETISAVAQQIAKPAETQVKQEDLEDGHAISQDNFGLQSFDEDTKDEAEPPPRKRARRTAAVKAQISIAPESDDDDDDIDNTEAMTKVEGESEESDGEDRDPSYGEVPGTSADDQAGPSGVGKDGVEAPYTSEDSQSILQCRHYSGAYLCRTLTPADIASFRDEFYSFKEKCLQDAYILRNCRIKEVKRRRPKTGHKSPHDLSVQYLVTRMFQDEMVPVCRTAFLTILNVSKCRTLGVLKRFKSTSEMPKENRGGDRRSHKFLAKRNNLTKCNKSVTDCDGQSTKQYLHND